MKTAQMTLTTLFVSTLAASLLVACSAKDRGTSFSQGQGQNLLNIADYNNKTFTIKTGQVAKADDKVVAVKASEKVSQESEAQSLPLVEFTTDAKLLQEVPLRGRPNFTYEALYRVTDNYLKIYQVGAKKDIDKDQHTYAEELADGRLAVPLMGYPIKGFYNVEKLKNSDNEETNKLGEFSKNRDEASQFRIDVNAVEIFEAVSKENLFLANFFKGDWYYAATIVEATENTKGYIGYELGMDEERNAANRIRFVLTENSMMAQNVNIDSRLDRKDDINLVNALTIPASWKEFEQAKRGRDFDLREKENTAKKWNDRKYVQLDLNATKSFLSKTGGRLTNLSITDNYFSFVLQIEEPAIRIRYAFLRAPEQGKETYKAKRHFSDDAKLFGYFTTERQVAKNFSIQHKEDIEKNIMISRFNPNAGQIVFHFSKTSPQWVRAAVRESVQAWDTAFVAAGTKLRVSLDESFDVEVGDIRYNVINMIESLIPGDLLGLGPSVADSLTGEIISATTNVHLTPIQEGLEREVRNFIRNELGLLNPNYSQGIGALLADVSKISMGKASVQDLADGKEVKNMVIQGNSLGRSWKMKAPTRNFNEIGTKALVRNTVEIKPRSTEWAREHDVAVTSKNFHQDIREKCPEVSAYVQELKQAGVTYNENQAAVLSACARKLVLPKMQGTLIHELGHNFGLRHNFMGSVDKNNFWPQEHTKTDSQVRSSSVMEYPSFQEDRLTVVGAYDIAAIRYGYADAVLLNDNKTIEQLNTDQSIQQNLGEKKSRAYLFCTDEDVMNGKSAFCDRWDAGTTASEIIDNHIQEYHSSTALLNYRYDHYKTFDPIFLAVHRIERYLNPMRRFYEEWRLHLGNYLGANRRYLQGTTEEGYQQILKNMENDPQYAAIYKAYKPAADRIYSFLKAVSMMSNRYCVSQDAEGIQSLLELSVLRDDIFRTSGLSIRSCNDPNAKAHLASLGLSIVGQYGHFLDDLRFDMSPEKVEEPLDIVGTYYDRWVASLFLTMHHSTTLRSSQQNFYPSLMDEPQYRQDWSQVLENRVLSGVDTQAIKKSVPEATKLPDRVEVFSAEKSLLASQFEDLMRSLTVPEDMTESRLRKKRYESTFRQYPAEEGRTTYYDAGYYFSAKPHAKFGDAIITAWDNLQEVVNPALVTAETMQPALTFIEQSFPPQAEMDKMTVEKFSEIMEAARELKFAEPAARTAWIDAMKPDQKLAQKYDYTLEGMENLVSEQCLADQAAARQRPKKKFRVGEPIEFEVIPVCTTKEDVVKKQAAFNATLAKDFYAKDKSQSPFELSKEHMKARIDALIAKGTSEANQRSLEQQMKRFDQSMIEKTGQLDLLRKVMYQMAD